MDQTVHLSPHLRGPHWSFAVELYQRPRVSNACLTLQDTLGVDVCVLLFVLFMASEHRTILDGESLKDLDRTIAEWRSEVVWPLRAIRRRLKTTSTATAGAGLAMQALLQQIKAAEIDAEQIEFALLARHLESRGHPASVAALDIATVLDAVASFFAARAGSGAVQSPEIRSALRDIALAMAKP